MLRVSRLLSAVLMVGAVFTSAQADEPPFIFAGFTDEITNALPDTIDGGQGMLQMHALCRDDFGALARMCTSREFWMSPNATAPIANAWVHGVGGDTFDFVGIGRRTCEGWTSVASDKSGSVVTTDGKPSNDLLENGCDVVRPVACCRLVR